jgi:hypothetical protein
VWVDDNPTITLVRILAKVEAEFGKSVSRDCVFRVLRNFTIL